MSKNVREISDVSVDNENKFLEYELNNKKNDCYSHLKYNNKFCISVCIRNNYINALIDTGSELNVLDISLAQKSKSIIKNFFTLKNANKSEIETYGKQNVDIKIGNHVYRNIEVVLADLKCKKLILGSPFINIYIKNIDVAYKQVIIKIDTSRDINHTNFTSGEQLITDNESVFANNKSDIGLLLDVEHEIQLSDSIP
ncbi:hypothetical protein COBT_003183, partial [Conglomerata obtusa]